MEHIKEIKAALDDDKGSAMKGEDEGKGKWEAEAEEKESGFVMEISVIEPKHRISKKGIYTCQYCVIYFGSFLCGSQLNILGNKLK